MQFMTKRQGKQRQKEFILAVIILSGVEASLKWREHPPTGQVLCVGLARGWPVPGAIRRIQHTVHI